MLTKYSFNFIIAVVLTLTIATVISAQTHFNPPAGNPFSPMNIFIIAVSDSGQNMVAGDEVGIFDDDLLVGTKVLTREVSPINFLEIIASKNDGSGNGFIEGDSIIFKLWDASAQQEYTLISSEVQFHDTQTMHPIDPVPFTGYETVAVSLTGRAAFSLTMLTNPVGSGITTPSFGVHGCDSSEVVNITATPLAGYQFVNWSGGVTDPNSATTSVEMNQDMYITANFEVMVPVKWVSFNAKVHSNTGARQDILLTWQTASENNNYGFEIERSFNLEFDSWETLGFVSGHGTTNSPNEYNFADETVTAAGTCHYRLKQIDTDGTFEYSNVIAVQIQQPLHFNLAQNYPNPFNPTTTIAFDLPEAGNVKLVLMNTLGEVVKTIAHGEYHAGHYEVVFDSQDLSTGVYFYRIEAGEFMEVRKLVVTR